MKYCIDHLKSINGYAKALEVLDFRGRISIAGKLDKADDIDSGLNIGLPVNITGPSDSQKAHVCYALCQHLKTKGVFIAYNEMQARRAFEDFSVFLGESVVHFPSREVIMHDVEAKSNDAVFERIKALQRIINGKFELIVTSIEAIALRLIPPSALEQNTILIRIGSEVFLTEIVKKLALTGYERIDRLEGRGQFAVRGGILDIFPVDAEGPVRIEFFGDEVDSIRYFDVETQRSIGNLSEVTIPQAAEIPVSSINIGRVAELLNFQMKEQAARLAKLDPESAENIKGMVGRDIDRFLHGDNFAGIDRYIPQVLEKTILIDYISEDALVFIDELARQKQKIENLQLEHFETCKSMLEKGSLLPESTGTYLDFESLEVRLKKGRRVLFNTLSADPDIETIKCPILSKSLNSYQGQIELLINDLKDWKSSGYSVVIFSGTRSRGERLKEMLRTRGIESFTEQFESNACTSSTGSIVITRGSIGRGFEYPEIKLIFLSESGIFMPVTKKKRVRTKSTGKKLELFTELTPGDYVVHQVHGIGLYVGIEQLTVENVKKDYLKIRYKDGDYLYIPGTQLELLQKYIGAEGKSPKLSKLGGTDWTKTKKKVSESLKKLAEGLIELYAKRQALKGYSFSPDTVWQKQFEDMFPYEETEDQLKCIEEIKRDMETSKPADRLLCGDVGYGKTEVAIRAAFKAVMDGKQVAYLVPTTVLAHQHYNTFKERMRDFPVSVEMLSRFRTPTQQKKIIKDLKSGMIDIIIGTHRILQKDIRFKDLGLLIVDEEQRFGVSHKERMKNIRPDVDVLTLTATPIPRTLHMSMIGIRDISVIEQPPEDRYPVQTYVMEYNDDIVREAIMREISRGGQVFYLSNRVRTIELKASKIQQLCPEARIGIAHGQMEESSLEDVMMGFIKGEFDVLVCTTIIESGLDMPNVNTIIVENADRLGLAQLYQIRGRVGRSNRLAYAYITYKRDKVLPEAAEKRLQAIKEFTEFGSGFKIAMRDLEIRGAGNILGPEQHGHIATVGYDTYCRLLEDAIRELRGEPERQPETEVMIDLSISAYIDSRYIRNEALKIEMYKRIASIENEEDVADIRDELLDRFGDIPAETQNLVEVAHIKALARSLGIISVIQKGDAVQFGLRDFGTHLAHMIRALSELSAAKYKRRILLNATSQPYFIFKLGNGGKKGILENIKILLQDIKNNEEQ